MKRHFDHSGGGGLMMMSSSMMSSSMMFPETTTTHKRVRSTYQRRNITPTFDRSILTTVARAAADLANSRHRRLAEIKIQPVPVPVPIPVPVPPTPSFVAVPLVEDEPVVQSPSPITEDQITDNMCAIASTLEKRTLGRAVTARIEYHEREVARHLALVSRLNQLLVRRFSL
jgi:hypothetical protein